MQIYRNVPGGAAFLDELELWQIGQLVGFDLREPSAEDWADDPEIQAHLESQAERAAKAAQVAEIRKQKRAEAQAARKSRGSEKR